MSITSKAISSKTSRALFAGLPHLLAGTPAIAVLLLQWDRLPENLATRFDFAGTVTDDLSRPGVLGITITYGVGMGVLFGALYGSGSGARRNRGVSARWFAALSWSTAGLIAPPTAHHGVEQY